jgi:predicted MFS family arabinose efflux permease
VDSQTPVGKYFVLALTIVFLAITISGPIVSLLSLDIAKTYFPESFAAGSSQAAQNAAVGAVTQIATINSAFEVVFALIMSLVAVRLKHKSLLLIGVILVFISAVGSFLAPNLLTLQVFFGLEGAGTIMVAIMGYTMVGEFLPFSKKAKTVSYLVATTALVTLVAAPPIVLISNFGGWRLNFLLLVLPVSLFGLLLAFFALPYESNSELATAGKNVYLTGFKKTFKNRSAASCLIGGMLAGATAVGTFALTFYRQQLGLPLSYASGIMMIATSMYVVASLLIGRFVNQIGARILVIVAALGNGIFTSIFFFMPSWWIALPLDMLHVWFGAATFTAFQCLILDQVPEHRPTLLSLRSIFGNLGLAIGAALGGAMLILFGSYQAVGVAFAITSFAAAGAFLMTKDTTKASSVITNIKQQY